MTVLSAIEKLNRGGINPDMSYLLKNVSVFGSHLEYILHDLLQKGYIKRHPNSAIYDTYEYSITQDGKEGLVRLRIKVADFMVAVRRLHANKRKNELYRLVMEGKDMIWFAYSEKTTTLDELRDFAKHLEMNIQRLWLDESFQRWIDRNWSGPAPH